MAELKLGIDEQELAKDALDSDSWPVILKLIEDMAKRFESKVMSYNLSEGPDGLVIEKARAEGARALFTDVKTLKAKLFKKE
jgi:hypothetical protein